MKQQIQNRILAFFLAVVMLCSSAPFPAISVEPEQPAQKVEQEETATSAYSKYVGSLAEISFDFYSYLVVSDDPSIAVQDGQELVATDILGTLVLEIVDYYWDEESCALWYMVAAAPGCVLPEKLQQNPWVFQNYTDVYEDEEWESYSPDSLILRENMEIPTLSSDTGVAVSAFNLPDGATVSAETVTINGETIAGMYDIKIIVDGEEWQPIDYGTTVRVSIPVEGNVATITHFLDYAPAIENTPNVEYFSLEGFTEEERKVFQDAVAASDKEGYIALEVHREIAISNGFATITTNSFSAYKADGSDTQHKAIWVNNNYSDTETIPVGANNPFTNQVGELNCVFADVVYVDQEGSEINNQGKTVRVQTLWTNSASGTVIGNGVIFGKCNVDMHYSINNGDTWIDMNAGAVAGNPDGNKRAVAAGNIPSNTFDGFSVGQEIWVVLTDKSSSPTKYVLLKMIKVATPAKGTVTFIRNDGTTMTTVSDVFDGPTDSAPNGQQGDNLPSPDWENPGYRYDGWKVVAISDNVPGRGWVLGNTYTHYPALRHGSVTLEAVWTPLLYDITYDLSGGEMFGDYPTTYKIEDTVVLPIPTREGHTFTGWTPDGTGNWGTDEIPRGSSVKGKYGDVTLKAGWTVNSGIAYMVRHIYEGLPGQENEVFEETLHDGTYGQKTNAVVRKVVGFTGPDQEDVEQKLIGDEPVVVEIYYTRNVNTITWDPNNGQETLQVPYAYGMVIYPQTAPVNTGYQFVGWNGYAEGMTMPDENVTFTALWAVDVYTVTFDSNGGSDLTPVNFAYNATVSLGSLPIPTREGHTFTGWTAPSGVVVTDNQFNMPARNIIVTATWEAATYTVTFKDYNGKVIDTQAVKYGEAATAPADPTREGYTFTGWDKGYSNVTSDLTVTAQYTVNTYTITWIVDGNKTTETYEYGAAITPPADPEKEGHSFAGWSPDVPATMPAENMEFVALWDVNIYKVTWNVDGVKTEVFYAYGEMIIPLEDPEKEGHTFAGWSLEVPMNMPAKDMEFVAQWAKNIYKVTWIVDGVKTEVTYEYGAAIEMPETPQKTGYTFADWSEEIPDTMPANNLTFTALWTPNTDTKYVVKHYQQNIVDDGYTLVDTENLTGTTATEVTPGVKNYTGFTAPEPKTVTIQADGSTIVEYYYDRELYTILWKNADGTVLETDNNVKYGATPVYNGATPAKAATVQHEYAFAGWTPKIVAATGNATYTATFTEKLREYTITFVNDDGTELQSSKVVYGDTPTYTGETPIKATDDQYSYTFYGWTPAIDTVTGEATYTATYTQTKRVYTVTYERGLGLESTTQEYLWGTTVTIDVVDPAYTGFAFLGWQCDIAGCACAEGVYHQFGYAFTMPAADVVLTAQWDPKPYTLTYNGEGVTQTQEFYAAGKTVVVAAAPIRDGYKFTGWNDEVTGTVYQPGEEFTMPEENVTLTAQWTVKTYTITFVDWNGNVLQTAQVQYGIMAAVPANPSRPRTMDYSYKFTGWSPAVVNVTGDQTYTATYEALQHYVYIGINYSYHMSTYQYTYPLDGHSKQNAYHQFPNEPRELWMEAMRAAYQPDGSWNLYPADNSGQLTGLPSEFINETLLRQHAVATNSAYGVFDSTGDLVKSCFQFSADDTTNTQMYEALIKVWLKQGILGGTDIYWDKVPPENCKVIPYVVKQQGNGNWYVDMVIVVDETSLTIEAPKVEGSDGQIFLFEITATDHPGFGFVVAVPEGESVVINGLFPGKEYIVKELTGWSWRSTNTPTWAYTTDENPNYAGILPNLDTSGEGDTAKFTLGTTSNKLVVSNTWVDTDWLSDEDYTENKFPPFVEITP